MGRMTWNNLHDFVLLGAGVLLLGMLAAFYPDPRPLRYRYRVLSGTIAVAALLVAVYLLAVWRSQ
jgi:hypothetical protein